MRVNALLVRYEGGFREASSTGLEGTDGSPLTTPGGELLLSTSQGAGRIEGFVNYPEDSAVEADRKAASTISTLETARWQTTVGIEPTGSGDIPLTHWDVGDTITVPDQDGSPQVVPVIGLLLTEDEAGHPVYRPQVGDSIPSLDERRSTTARNYNSGDLGGRDRQAQPRGAARPGVAAKLASPSIGEGGCCSETFRLIHPFASAEAFVAGPSGGDYDFSLPPSATGEYATSNISITSDDVVVPAGLWQIVAEIDVKVNTDPSSGRFTATLQNFDLDSVSIGGDTVVDFPHGIFDPTHGFSTTFGHHVYFPEGGRIRFTFVNNLNVAGSTWGVLSGVMACPPCGSIDVG